MGTLSASPLFRSTQRPRLAASLVCALLALLAGFGADARAATVLSDTFDGTALGTRPAGWTIDPALGSAWSVETAPAGMSGSALRALKSDGSTNYGTRTFTRQTAATSVSFKVRTGADTSAAARYGEFVLMDYGGGLEIARVRFVGGKITVSDGGFATPAVVSTAPNTTYTVVMTVDPALDRWKVAVNGTTYDNGGAWYAVPFAIGGVDTFRVVPSAGSVLTVADYVWLDDLTVSGALVAVDTTPPSVPAGLSAVPGDGRVTLSWSASTDDTGVSGYRVYRNGTLVGAPTTTSYADSGLSNGASYSYTVRAIDATGNLSNASTAVSATPQATADTTAPSVPTGLSAVPGNGQVSLSWSASTDNSGVSGYRVYRNGTQVGSSSTTSYTDTGLSNGASYSYTVRAIDAAGNLSNASTAVTATPQATADTTAPSVPTGLSAVPGDARVSLSWAASTDNVGVTGYRVYRGGTLVASPAGTTYTDTGLTNATSYSYTVRAADAAGNLSNASSAVSATPQAAVSGTCPLFGAYDGFSQPGSCWRPYAATSPFNRPVPANPRKFISTTAGTDSSRIVARLLSWGSAQNLVAGQTGTADYWHPLYYARSSDPLYTVHCTQWTSSCQLEGRQVRIPVGARPAGGGDGHLSVIDQDTGVQYDMWKASIPSGTGGTLNIAHGGLGRIDGDGLGSNATAAHFGLPAGIIRGADMQAGVIPHALFAMIKCTGGYSVYPAAAGTTASSCSSFGLSNQDAPPLGARLWLDLTPAQIDALAVPAWKKTILKAMNQYGILIGDTNNGGSAWGIQAESEQAYASFGRTSYWRTLGAQTGAGTYGGGYVFNVQSGVDWAAHLHVLDPCVSQGTC